MDPQVAIVVVNWNSGDQLRACVESVLKYGAETRLSVTIVDNGSTDGSAELIATDPLVKVVRMGKNLGFAKACNLGARHAGNAEFLLFLNPDARLLSASLQRCVAFMHAPGSESYAICGVALRATDGSVARSCGRFPTPKSFLALALGLDKIWPTLGPTMREWDHCGVRQVDQVIGAFFFVRKSAFDLLKGFDERFFVYFEEVDFSLRAVRAGMRSAFLGDAVAFHAGGGTSESVRATRLFYSLRSRLLYSTKHFSRTGHVVVLFVSLLIEPLSRTFDAARKGGWSSVRDTWGGYRRLVGWLVGFRHH
jgi:GT2 family glycosyltransferase